MAFFLDGISIVLVLLSLYVTVQTVVVYREKRHVRQQTRALVKKALRDLESDDVSAMLEACQVIGEFGGRQDDDIRGQVYEALARLSMSHDQRVARQANVAFGRSMGGS